MTLSTAKPRHPRLYIHSPEVILSAQVHLPDPQEYPAFFVAYDNVTSGAFGNIRPGMLLTLGTTPLGDDLGRTRVNDVADAIAIPIAYSSRGTRDGEVLVVNNTFVTVWDDRRPWARRPFIDIAGEQFKDGNFSVGTNTTQPLPVACMGAGTAGTAIAGELIVLHNGQPSYAVADGATITDYLWDIADGTLVSGTLTDSFITVSYPPGFRWVRLQVADSNGKFNYTERPVFVDDPDSRQSIDSFKVISHSIDENGVSLSVRITADLPRADYPDGTLMMIWDREPGGASNRDHMMLIGWHHTEQSSIGRVRTGLQKNTTLTIFDVGGKANFLPGFPQSLADDALRVPEEEPETTWQYMTTPNIDKFMSYLVEWHSNLHQITDVFTSGVGADYPFVELQAGGGSMLAQLRRLASMIVPDYRVVINNVGQIKTIPDLNLIDLADRPATEMVRLGEEEWEEVSWDYTRPPSVGVLWGQALLAADSYVTVGDDEVISFVRSIAPGEIYSQGPGESTWIEQLAQSQADLNAVTGHRYERLNARYGPLTIRVPGDLVRTEFDYTAIGWIVLECDEQYAAQRGIPGTEMRGILRSISISYGSDPTGETITGLITMELETSGVAAPAYSWTDLGAVPDDGGWLPPEPIIPLEPQPGSGFGPGQELMAGIGADGFVYRTTDFQTPSLSGGPTWDRVDLGIAGTIYSWVVDPFSPGYLGPTGDINGWIVNDEAIYRVTDLFGSPGASIVHTFDVATDISQGHWRSIQASFGAFFSQADSPWLLCVSHYADAEGHTGTWAIRSLDGGDTWLGEVQISPFYDGGSPGTMPIGVYTSPKTAGLAYAMAYYQGGSPAKAGGYKSLDWGQTWTLELEDENPLEPRPGIGVQAVGEAYEYLGRIPEYQVGSFAHGHGSSTRTGYIIIHPPDGTKKIWIEGEYGASYQKSGGFTHGSASVTLATITGLTETGDLPEGGGFSHSAPENGSISGSYEYTSARIGSANWPRTREAVEGGSTGNNQAPSVSANTLSIQTNTTAESEISARVTQIQRNDDSLYTPSYTPIIDPLNGLGGAIHLPWPDNADEGIAYYGQIDRASAIAYALIQSIAGVKTDISPVESGVSYGPNGYGFTIRSYDSDRDFVALAGVGNDAGTAKVGLWVSNSGGGSWTNILAPVALTNAQYSLQIAFAGDDPNTLFVWGGKSDGSLEAMYYSEDFGASLDSRQGNLESSFGGVAFVGIAGGPLA